MLKLAGCEIISKAANKQVDAYILSESSMFISRRRFVLKTCGRTTPLECLNELRCLAIKFAGYDEIAVRSNASPILFVMRSITKDLSLVLKVEVIILQNAILFIDFLPGDRHVISLHIFFFQDIFYSRKSFSRPELQLAPYQSFEQEVAALDEMFPNGSAYCLGTIYQLEFIYFKTAMKLIFVICRCCWYLYTLNPLNHYQSDGTADEPDQTIEILMTELNPKVMDIFVKKNVAQASEATMVNLFTF